MTKQTLLMVDDQSEIKLLLRDVLAQKGYTVHTSEMDLEALGKFGHLTIDLVIIDYQLPQIGGPTVVKNFIKKHDHAPLIVLSG